MHHSKPAGSPTERPGQPDEEREELLELLLEASSDGVMDIDFVRGATTYSDRWKSLLGYEKDLLVDSPWLWRELSHPDDLPQVDALLREHLDEHWPFNHTWRMRHHNGEWRWMMCRAVTARESAGQPTRLVAVFSDISDRIRSEENQRALVSAIPDLLLRLRADGTIVDVKVPDQSPEGITWPRVGDLLSTWAPAQYWHESVLAGIRSRAQASGPGVSFEVSLSGSTPRRQVEVRLAPGASDEGVCIVRDVSEQRNLQSQLLQANKLESIGQLAAGIAHEINTPMQFIGDNLLFLQDAFPGLLSVLQSYQEAVGAAVSDGAIDQAKASALDELREQADLEYVAERAPKAISSAREGVTRVARILSAMKEFSHPGTKEKTLATLNRELETTITIATNVWKDVAKIETDFDPELPAVRCHPGEINQVFLNLIVNAAHAVEDVVVATGTLGTITIRTRASGDFVEIRISDTGGGIPEKIRDRIFDPFFTTKEVGRGTGQGLALARSTVVDGHGGSISFETEVGQGTTFVVRLPLAAPNTPSAP